MVHFAYFPLPLAEGLVCFYPPAKMEAVFCVEGSENKAVSEGGAITWVRVL